MPAVAITDHGNVFGAYDFWKQATDAGIKPIIGTEAYITPGTHRGDKTRVRWGNGRRRRRLRLGRVHAHDAAVRDHRGHAQPVPPLEPRLDRGLLLQAAHGPRAARRSTPTGLIATTGCPSGEVQTRLRLGQYDEAVKAASDYPRHLRQATTTSPRSWTTGSASSGASWATCCASRRSSTCRWSATNDLHYTHAHDAKSHAALLCVQSGSTLDDPNRFKFDADEFYLKTAAEMRHVFRDHPEACDNTLLIAERCDVSFNTSANYMPRFPVPEGESEETWFVKEVDRGLARALPRRHPRRGAQAGRLRGRRHHCRWASPATSSSSPTSSTGRRTTASGSAPAVAPAPGRWPPTRCASPTSTRCSTA